MITTVSRYGEKSRRETIAGVVRCAIRYKQYTMNSMQCKVYNIKCSEFRFELISVEIATTATCQPGNFRKYEKTQETNQDIFGNFEKKVQEIVKHFIN